LAQALYFEIGSKNSKMSLRRQVGTHLAKEILHRSTAIGADGRGIGARERHRRRKVLLSGILPPADAISERRFFVPENQPERNWQQREPAHDEE
jgi:hypothetical protein